MHNPGLSSGFEFVGEGLGNTPSKLVSDDISPSKAVVAFLMVMAAHVVVASKCLAEEVDVGYGLCESIVIKLVNLGPVEDAHDCSHLGGDPVTLLGQCARS